MALKVERRDGTLERQVLVGMVISRAVLGPIAERWSHGLFASKWANMVGSWCVQHYRKYRKPPKGMIEQYFRNWEETERDKETIAAIETLLVGLSDECEHLKRTVSPDFLVDAAAELFEKVRLRQMSEQVQALLEVNDTPRAREVVDKSRKIELGVGAGVNVLVDEEVVRSAFELMGESVVKYPGAAGNFFGSMLGRDCFVSFLASDKRGKSFFLQDLAVRSVVQGNNTAYFELGDHSQHQVMRRLASRITGRPTKPYRYSWPLSMESNGPKDIPELKTEWREDKKGLTPDETLIAFREVADAVGDDRFKLTCHPNSTLSVAGIDNILEGWARDGWTPDVCVVDYSDLAAPLDSKPDRRDQIDATWRALRALSQRWHCLVATATQADADSYDSWILSRSNFSEDKRKNAHVTGMIGINQTAAEKEEGIFRLNWVNGRDLDFGEKQCLWVAGCLACASPIILSTF